MKRAAFLIFAASFAGALYAQSPLISEAKQQYTMYRNNLIKAAEAMPEADYSFKPTPVQRTFGELMLHIAGQYRTCGAVKGGEQKAIDTKGASKEAIVTALKDSFEVCDAAWNEMNDTTAHEMIAGRGGQHTKLGILIGSAVHDAEEYGYAAVYMRLKNVTPPSSAR